MSLQPQLSYQLFLIHPPSFPSKKLVLIAVLYKKGKYRPKTEVLVKWVGAPSEDATWENLWRFSKSYPTFILEDKDSSSGGE